MNTKNLTVRRAGVEDMPVIQHLIRCLAAYEKRPQDVTGTEEQLKYWLFERKAAAVLLAECEGETLGYALYYPVFGSFSAMGKIHLEDLFIRPEFRGLGFGRLLFAEIAEMAAAEGYMEMEWSCLDWNEPAIEFYKKSGAVQENGRVYFRYKTHPEKNG